MSKSSVHDFGIVDVGDDFFELHWQTGENNRCRLESIIQTERGPRRDGTNLSRFHRQFGMW